MNPEELPNLQKVLLEFFAAEQEMKALQAIVDRGTGKDPKVARALEEVKSRVASLEPMANEAKIKIREGLSSGLLAQSGGKIVLASDVVPEVAAAPALKTSIRGTETLAKKGEVTAEELAASTAAAQERALQEKKLAELAAPAAVAPKTPEPEQPKAPPRPMSGKAQSFEEVQERLRQETMAQQAEAAAKASAPVPIGRKPPDVTRIEMAIGAISKDQAEYLKFREELVKKFGVDRIDFIPETPEAEATISKFLQENKPRIVRGERGRFGSAPKAVAGETPEGGTFTPVPKGRSGFIEAKTGDAQMAARRELQAVDFKKQAKGLSTMKQDELIDKWLGGANGVMWSKNQQPAVRAQMVEVALLRDMADRDIGETNLLDDWKKRVDQQADMFRGRGPVQGGRGDIKPDAIQNLRGQAMTVQGKLKNNLLNVRMTKGDRATQASIEAAEAPKRGTLSETGEALGRTPGVPGVTPPAPAPSAPPAATPAPSGGPLPSGGFKAPGEAPDAPAPVTASAPAPAATPASAPAPTASAAGAPAVPPAAGAALPTGGFKPVGAGAAAAEAPAAGEAPAKIALGREWRKAPVTPGQKRSLINQGVDEAKVPKTFGEASDMIDELTTKQGKFVPITDEQKKSLLAAGVDEADLPKSKFAASQDLREIKNVGGGAVPAGGSFKPVAEGAEPAATGKDTWRTKPVSPRQASSLKKGVKDGLITQEQVDAITNQGAASNAIKFLKKGKRVPKTVTRAGAAAATAATAATPAATAAASAAAPTAAAPAGAPTSLVGMLGPTAGATAPAGAAAGSSAVGRVGSKLAGLGRFLGPLAAIYGAYQVVDLLKQGTLDAADERRLKMMEALGAVSGGARQQQMMNDQMRQMRFMADMAAIQRQQSGMQQRNQSISDQALSSLLRGHEASLQALAMPSQPSVGEMMARM